MTILADFAFKDGHGLEDYKIKISENYPLEVKIKDNILLLKTHPSLEGKLTIDLDEKQDNTALFSVVLKKARGMARIGSDMFIDNPIAADVESVTRLSTSGGYSRLVMTVDWNSKFQFSGYRIEKLF